MTIISSASELSRWVQDHVDPDASNADVGRIVKALWDDNDSPNWGDDWQPYFDTLPDNLYDVLPIVEI